MSIATKTGDGGRTKLLFGLSVSKSDLRVEAYGTIDELNSFLGLARAECDDVAIKEALETFQRESFVVAAELATPSERLASLKSRVSEDMVAALDQVVTQLEKTPGLLDDWALPGATRAGAALDVARSVARRAERCAVRLHDSGEPVAPVVLRYLNRLSDVLWLLGRSYEIKSGADGALRPGR